MTITLNGLTTPLVAETSVARLVAERSLPPSGVAVAVNGDVVRTVDWARTTVRDGDVVEIVHARQGG